MKGKITLYLLQNLSIIMGEDKPEEIIDACKVLAVPQGQALVPLFMGGMEGKQLGMTIKKDTLAIVETCKVRSELVDAYKQFLTGERPPQKKVIPIKGQLKGPVH